ncbi:hypothetical protein C5S53_06820 [Methanophagales archaeon]|nr:hypothetical protein C5S53_06820 [Methanophagales archaeon]
MIAAQKSDEPLIADVKIFNPEKGKGTDYIAKGFNQIYLYTLDYNEPFGYLIIYNTSGQDLRFALANQEQTTPFVVHNNKTIFVVTIDIFETVKGIKTQHNILGQIGIDPESYGLSKQTHTYFFGMTIFISHYNNPVIGGEYSWGLLLSHCHERKRLKG